jgi:hypothetical protein
LIAGTRAALGAGIGLLLADRLPQDQRRAVGWTLLLVGIASTIPLAFEVFGGRGPAAAARPEECEREAAARSGDGRGRWSSKI